MPNISGQTYGLSVLTPIITGREADLQKYLEALPTGTASPLEKTCSTHLARWVIIPQLVYEGPPQKHDRLQSQYLLFESSFDGADLDAYLEMLCRQIPDTLDAVWGCCVGYPGMSDISRFKDYIRHNQIECTFFVAAYAEATVQDVRDALALREQFTAFAIAAQRQNAAALKRLFDATFSSADRPRAQRDPNPRGKGE